MFCNGDLTPIIKFIEYQEPLRQCVITTRSHDSNLPLPAVNSYTALGYWSGRDRKILLM
jgi:hypothetical protein